MGAPSKSTLISQGGSGFFSENSDSVLTRHDQNSAREKPAYTDTQKQVDTMVSNFVAQATEWHSLAAMMAGGLAYRYGKIAILGVGGEWAGTSSLANAFLRGASVAGGLGLEVLTFETVHRGLLTLSGHGGENPNMWSWNGQGGWKQGLASSYVNFGILKGAGALCNGQNIVVQHFFQDTAMVAGNNLTALLNLTPKPEGSLAEQLLHAEATNLQLAAGMGLVHLSAPGLISIERAIDFSLQAEQRSRLSFEKWNLSRPQLLMAVVGKGVGGAKEQGMGVEAKGDEGGNRALSSVLVSSGPTTAGDFVLRPQLFITQEGNHPRPERLEPVKNIVAFPKPRKGFWTSTYLETRGSAWVERGRDLKNHSYLLRPRADAKIYVVDSYEDLERLMNQYGREDVSGIKTLDYEAMSRDYDGLHLTRKGEVDTRPFQGRSYDLDTWDVESTLWFRWVFEQAEDAGPTEAYRE
ncbi:MAG: hypothetical protein U1F57_00440 [bacterium]